MKQIYYLSIQGSSAPAFWYKNHDAQNFRSLIESITLSSTLFISSIYRTDLFYRSEKDLSESILHIWCTCKGIHYDHMVKSKFVRAEGLDQSFAFYFESLVHLMTHRRHYERYKERLNEIHQQEDRNTILNELMKCDLHMAKSYQKQQLNYMQLSSVQQDNQPFCLNRQAFRVLADEFLKEKNYN